MTDLYFLKIFFIDKILPYTFMTLSIAYLLLEIIAPRELRFVFYDFSDRLFFKFIYRPINKTVNLIKSLFLLMLTKLRDALAINQKKKIIRTRKRTEKKVARTEKRQTAAVIKNQKKEAKAQEKLVQKEEQRQIKAVKKEKQMQDKMIKKEEKLQYKMENKRLKSETTYKLKLFIAYKLKKIINRNQQK